MDDKDIIYTIHAYELAIELPEDERVTFTDEYGIAHLHGDDSHAHNLAGYADKCIDYLTFGDEVDEASIGAFPPYEQIKVCDTPNILLRAGFEQKPMLYTQRHLEMAIHPKDITDYHWHGLSVPTIKRLPELLENPVLLSDSPARNDVLIAVLCAVDNDSLPLLTAIKPDGKGIYHLQTIETNFILSVYGKNEFELYFKQRITPEKIVYYNEKQGQKLERLVGIQFPDYYSSIAPNTIIKLPCCINNPKTPVQNGLSVHLESTADKKENWNITDEMDKLGKLDKQATVEHAEELPFDIGDSGDDNR